MKKLSAAANAELLALSKRGRRVLFDAQSVVDYAADESTKLHALFEWDDTEAGRLYRLEQARDMIRMCITIIPGTEKTVRAFVSLSIDRSTGGGYRGIGAVMDDADMHAVMLEDALAELQLFERRYKELRALEALWGVTAVLHAKAKRKSTGSQPAA